MQLNRILLPLDGSELAETALAPATALAEALSAEIVLLRVVDPPSIKHDPDLFKHIIEGDQNQVKVYLNSIESRSLSLFSDTP